MKRKIAIIKIADSGNDYEVSEFNLVPDLIQETDWREVNDQEYNETLDLINFANRNRWSLQKTGKIYLQLVEFVREPDLDEYLNSAREMKKQFDEKRRKDEEKERKAKEKRAEAARKREADKKLKQYEKLKAEIEGSMD